MNKDQEYRTMEEQREDSPLISRAADGIEDDDEGGIFSDVSNFVRESLKTDEAAEAFVDEYHHVKDAMVDHLHNADDGEDFFMDMNLVRNLSILPSQRDIKETMAEVTEAVTAPFLGQSQPHERHENTENLNLTTVSPRSDEVDEPTSVPLSAYFTLLGAVLSLSSIGPFLAAQKNVEPTMKIVWRFQGTALALAPLMISVVSREGFPSLTKAEWMVFVMSSFSYAVLCVAFAMSIDYTSVANATILTNSQSLLLIIAKLMTGNDVVFWEGFGVFVAFTGAVLCSRDAAQTQDNLGIEVPWWNSLYGDALGLVSSVGGIGYIVLGKRLRSTMPVLVFMVLNMTVASILILFFMCLMGQDVSLDRHVDHGVWGWMNLRADRLPLEMLTVIICNLLGTMGYVRAFKYFSSVVIAVAALLEPVVASFTAVLMHVDVLPGAIGWAGNILVILGTLAVLYPTASAKP